jgi:hypothetical protein
MKTLSKIIVGMGVAGVLAASSIAPASAARWHRDNPGAAAAGFVGGLAVGAAAVAASPFTPYNDRYYGGPAAYGYEYGYPQTYSYQGGDRLHNSVGNF